MSDWSPAGGTSDHLLTAAAAEEWVERRCITSGPPGRIGVELELILAATPREHARRPGPAPNDRAGLVDLDAVRAELVAQPVRGKVTLEPGGQVEISADPADDLLTALDAAGADLIRLRRSAARHGAELVGVGLDPNRRPRRLLCHPRYEGMEAFFDRAGPVGRMMMCSTASVQVNVEAVASATDHGRRWQLLHGVGPALVAAFANSPLYRRRPTGWRSTRQAVWLALDHYRTRQPQARPGESVPAAWTRWCLDAPLMLVRRPHPPWSAPPGLTFRQWIIQGSRAVPDRCGPTEDDLAYHLTTLFPPVRARGHLEVRYLDAQPGDWWQAPVSVLAALTEDVVAADAALDACAPVRGRWWEAARQGMGDPALARAARGVLDAAARALRRADGLAPAAQVVEQFLENWTLRGRSPADDVLQGRPAPPAPVRRPQGVTC